MLGANDKAEQTKQLIATKAKDLFIQKGYHKASMEDIRFHSGMSKGSIYYHFKSKEALFLYILELYTQDWIDMWKEKSSNLKTANDKLYALAELFAMDFESPLMNASEEFARSMTAAPDIKKKIDELSGRVLPVIQGVITEGIRNKEFKNIDINEATIIVYGFLAGIGVVCQTVNNDEIPYMYKKAVDLFLNGFNA